MHWGGEKELSLGPGNCVSLHWQSLPFGVVNFSSVNYIQTQSKEVLMKEIVWTFALRRLENQIFTSGWLHPEWSEGDPVFCRGRAILCMTEFFCCEWLPSLLEALTRQLLQRIWLWTRAISESFMRERKGRFVFQVSVCGKEGLGSPFFLSRSLILPLWNDFLCT